MTSVAKEKGVEAIPDLVTRIRIAQVESVEFAAILEKEEDPKPSAIDFAVGGKVDGSDPRPDPGRKGSEEEFDS